MAYAAAFYGILVLLGLVGLGLLIAGAFSKKRRKKLLVTGCVLCVPLLFFVLFQSLTG